MHSPRKHTAGCIQLQGAVSLLWVADMGATLQGSRRNSCRARLVQDVESTVTRRSVKWLVVWFSACVRECRNIRVVWCVNVSIGVVPEDRSWIGGTGASWRAALEA